MNDLAQKVVEAYSRKNIFITTVESCTGGLIGAALTNVSGSSRVVDGGFITYSNEAKQKLVSVPAALLENYGAVSAEVAQAMAEGGLQNAALARVSVAVTGIAGPTGGTEEKPVGLVYIASAFEGKETVVTRHIFDGDRDAVRHQTVESALRLLLKWV